jgi:restriction endonuclease Mrr
LSCHKPIRTIGGTRATVVKYNQLRNKDASTAKNVRTATAIQQIEIIQRVRRDVMKPNFQEGFDEADRWKDVRGRPELRKAVTR